jgi:hypothetical protein
MRKNKVDELINLLRGCTPKERMQVLDWLKSWYDFYKGEEE